MTFSQKNKCRRIIHLSALAGAFVGAGLAQIPESDNLILVPIEIIMVISLGSAFGLRLRHSYRTALIVGTAATMIGRGISDFLVGWIPVLGNLFDAFTAVLVIEVLGWIVAREFERQARDLLASNKSAGLPASR
ncbi:hypothetical protein [Dinghuibacter silviterrae]|uniref:Uncharacterized protein (DUF697 family) n=1 Tax=Dinghuibacter silviterrae TaxID=1539049 RepID=A0A4R8DJ04_9BACT|nr:hypothetical protein [Dinghuibacter silviterrae]TDW97498.1 uncharacterized protein (DUF697 family) [Dinghuibacter silviterrae]